MEQSEDTAQERKAPTRTPIRVKLTPTERAALQAKAEAVGLTLHGLMVKVVREIIGAVPELLNDDVDALGDANAQAQAIGRNLNQLVRAVNTGRAIGVKVDREYLDLVAERVAGIATAIEDVSERQRNRWVPIIEKAKK